MLKVKPPMPAWRVYGDKVIMQNFFIKYPDYMTEEYAKYGIKDLHESIKRTTGEGALEVSYRTSNKQALRVSPYNLISTSLSVVEIEFLLTKIFDRTGTKIDFQYIEEFSPKEIEEYLKVNHLKRVRRYEYIGTRWEPKYGKELYDLIYAEALYDYEKYCNLEIKSKKSLNSPNIQKVLDYTWYTDFGYRQLNQSNCPARAIAVYKLLREQNKLNSILNKDLDKIKYEWIELHDSILLEDRNEIMEYKEKYAKEVDGVCNWSTGV